jgi:chromosome segregation ATPase
MFFVLLLPAVLGAEQYLITETQLRSIETLLEKSEQDRQSWQQQARGLKNEAAALNSEAAELRSESASLNSQLQTERERYRTLQQSFSRLEASRMKEKNRTAAKIAQLEAMNKLKNKLLIALFLIAAAAGWILSRRRAG